MPRRNLIIGGVVLLSAVVLSVACSGGGQQGLGFGPELIAQIREKAGELAEQEMARFAEAEEQWKDEVTLHRYNVPFTVVEGAYCKTYREFTGYEIVDIRLRDSLLHPIECQIKYHFAVYSTEGRGSDVRVNERRAQQDTEFSKRYSHHRTVSYQATFEGEFDLSEPFEFDVPHYLPPPARVDVEEGDELVDVLPIF